MKKILFLLVIIFTTLFANAEVLKKDSLLKVWNNKTLADTIRVQALHKIARDIYFNLDKDSSIFYGQIEYEFAKEKGLKLNLANAMTLMGVAYLSAGKNSKALNYFKQSLPIYQEIGYKRGIGAVAVNIGAIYSYNSDFKNALKYHYEGLSIFKEINEKPFMANALMNIGGAYYSQEEYRKSIGYFQMALKIHQELESPFGIATAFLNIGQAYFELRNILKLYSIRRRH